VVAIEIQIDTLEMGQWDRSHDKQVMTVTANPVWAVDRDWAVCEGSVSLTLNRAKKKIGDPSS
jgi:hypothetical protein